MRGHAPAVGVRGRKLHRGGKSFVVEVCHDRRLVRVQLLNANNSAPREKTKSEDADTASARDFRNCGTRTIDTSDGVVLTHMYKKCVSTAEGVNSVYV